jgi:pimeloyl-ACP methyl ester carboxylesterase
MLESICVPTLVAVGREDVYTPVGFAQQLVDRIAGAKLAVIENAGHLPNLERPEAFNEALSTWLKNL